MKIKLLNILKMLIFPLTLIVIGTVATFAWLTGSKEIKIEDIEGSIIAQYFHTGNGSEEEPFVITRPVHYFNLVNLYQRLDGFSNAHYYFQLGYDLNGDGELEVYNYSDDGNRVTTGDIYSKSLNLKYYSGENSLLPIGTSEKPFVGSFDGSGLTIKNLTIKGSENYGGSTTYSSADIGIFGFISGPLDKDGNKIMTDETDEEGNPIPLMASIKDVYYDSVTIDLTGADVSKICLSSDIHDSDYALNPKEAVADGQDTIYVGVIAGHVSVSNTVESVYINKCTIVGGTKAMCNFGYFGCVEDSNGAPVSSLGSLVASLRGQGDDAGFGGSIDMNKLYNRVSSIRSLARNNTFRYDINKTVTIDELANTITYIYPTPATGKLKDYYIGYSVDGGGNYIYFNRTGTDQYTYVSSIGENQLTSVSTYTYYANKDGSDYLYDDAFIVSDGQMYIGVSGTDLSTSNIEANAQSFVFEENYIFTRVDGEKLYLNANGTTGITLSSSKNTVWIRTNKNELYCTISGTKYYLDYNNGWILNSVTTLYKLSDGTHFISVNNANNSIVNSNEENAKKWILSNPTGNTTISYRIGNTYYYLGYNNDGSLRISNTQVTWYKDGNNYYQTIAGEKFYIVYDGSWKLAISNGYKLHDGNGHFLSATTTTIQNATEAASVEWILSNPIGTTTQICTIINGTKYYLRYNNGLTMSTTSTTWNKNGNAYYYSSNGSDYYIAYDNGWTLIKLSYQIITDGKGNYLRVAANNVFANTTVENDATHLYFSNTMGNASGAVYAMIDGSNYYLYNNNGTLNTTTTSGNATSWVNDGNSLSYTTNGIVYAICYDTEWMLKTINNGILITDGNGNYLRVTGTNNFDNTTSIDEASRFTFSNGTAGYISTKYGTQTIYLRNYYGTLNLTTSTNNRTNWSNDGTNIYNGNYYLVYNDSWKLSQTISETKYTISYNDYYLNINSNNDGVAVGNESNATLWTFQNAGNNPNGTISVNINGITYYLREASSNNGTLRISTSDNTTWYNNNGQLSSRSSSRYIRYYGDAWQGRSNTAQTLTITPVTISYCSKLSIINDATPSVSVLERNISAPQIERIDGNREKTNIETLENLEDFSIDFFDSKLQVIEKVLTEEKEGCYFPLRIGADDGENSNDYKTSLKNTGYVIGGSYSKTTPSQNWSVQNESGNSKTNFRSEYSADIRISEYPIKENIDNSYGNGSFSNIYTYDGTNRLLNSTEKNSDTYKVASEQFLNTLKGNTNVYGLHFMNAEISMNHVIVAKQATIIGKTYENYQFPESCIDFWTVERGTINFFAGTYFTGNNAFFSLHRIFRNENNDITAIKEIGKIYESRQYGNKRAYIYQFKESNGSFTYTNPDGTYTGATSLEPEYIEVFDTKYITNPTTISTDYLYYFEIPCNAGEYALGSVSGKTGAYLCYLDIGTNGGSVLESVISGEGNSITKSFNVDVRSVDDEKENYAILQYAVNVPDGATNENFSITVSFDSNARDSIDPTLYEKGLYTLNVVNRTGSDIELSVFLVDNDEILSNAFPYAFRLIYTNGDHNEEIVMTPAEYDVWKSAATFTIPSNGQAIENSYTK